MKIRCIAIDDEPLALNKLKRNILKFPYLEGEKKSTHAYSISAQQREFTTFLRGT